MAEITPDQVQGYANTAAQLGTTIEGLVGLFKKKSPSASQKSPAEMKAEFEAFVKAELAKRKASEPKKTTNNKMLYIGIGVMAAILVTTLVVVMVKNK